MKKNKLVKLHIIFVFTMVLLLNCSSARGLNPIPKNVQSDPVVLSEEQKAETTLELDSRKANTDDSVVNGEDPLLLNDSSKDILQQASIQDVASVVTATGSGSSTVDLQENDESETNLEVDTFENTPIESKVTVEAPVLQKSQLFDTDLLESSLINDQAIVEAPPLQKNLSSDTELLDSEVIVQESGSSGNIKTVEPIVEDFQDTREIAEDISAIDDIVQPEPAVLESEDPVDLQTIDGQTNLEESGEPIQDIESSLLLNPSMQDESMESSLNQEVGSSTMLTMIISLFLFFLLLTLLLVFFRKLKEANHRISDLGITDIESAKALLKDLQKDVKLIEEDIYGLKVSRTELKGEESSLQQECQKLDTKVENQKRKLSRTKELYAAVENAVVRFHVTDIPDTYFRPLSEDEKADLDTIAPSVMLNLNYMNYQDLRKEFRANQKQIDLLLEEYAKRYTTKANQSIYKLMVISLRSELQNILYNLKFEKLETALFQVQSLIAKYLVIVSEGNQQIAGTIRKFIGEVEHLFENAVKIEYEYYIKREQVRQEQLALRQQMREEAEERKRLKEQEKQIAIEESKYRSEIEKVRELLNQEPEDSPRRAEIAERIEVLNDQLVQVEQQKEEITKLQNGKAGNVYIISNLGSFGDHVFKVGMTRRLEPQDRVDELGSASVPFKFDVHSFIFSEDAVGLENAIHVRLNSKRLNKVNLRKEFFDVSLDELEQLVLEINPTAEFNRTMLAEDYNQSLSLGDSEIPMSDESLQEQEGDDEESENTDSE
ncbi:GIY-YIG nuclease family protein [uncultured Sphaerochaeta sp.]|uniref:GIY-YIG nuclease family protein n=1 Tax=uncultured Sphaerochaeta sp. TaxID=886478 RepID=UPI002A0A7514|nr:GIY-YIG nuclease family protein [uncultured Sphaerochaeta sp.]